MNIEMWINKGTQFSYRNTNRFLEEPVSKDYVDIVYKNPSISLMFVLGMD
jgi:hypothetical protein